MNPAQTWTVLSVALLCALALPGKSQCEDWSRDFSGPGLEPGVLDTLEFGGEIYATGHFAREAKGTLVNGIARWDGSAWHPLGAGLTGAAARGEALAVFDDGSGPAIYAAGSFEAAGGVVARNVARWDGAQWSALQGPLGEGLDGPAQALAVFDDGSGPALYVGGSFGEAGGVAAANLARWDGAAWSDLGAGADNEVLALKVLDDGNGTALFVGGRFSSAGGVAGASLIARFDGAWQSLGSGPGGLFVEDLAVFDDGAGPDLYASGKVGPGSPPLARWDGSTWTAVPGLVGVGTALAAPEGSSLLYLGDFQGRVFTWDGNVVAQILSTDDEVSTLEAYDGGNGPGLLLGGEFRSVGSFPFQVFSGIAAWTGAWTGFGSTGGLESSPDDVAVGALAGQPELYACGKIDLLEVPDSRVARHDGVSWTPIGQGFDDRVRVLAEYDEGAGPRLFAGGKFGQAGTGPAAHLARWDGSTWSDVGGGLDGTVFSLHVHDFGSGPALVVGGLFSNAGGAPASGIGRWDGSAWAPLGTGVAGNVLAMTTHDFGSGPVLVAGGTFTTAGGSPAQRVAVWDGAAWSALGAGFGNDVNTLITFDDGTGPSLYSGGWFSGGPTPYVARWDGAQWVAVGNRIAFQVNELAVLDAGSGPQLFAAGSLGLRRWNGFSWLDFGVWESIGSMDVSGDEVFLGGNFTHVGASSQVSADGISSLHVARWGPDCTCPPLAYCTAGTTANGCQATISAVGGANLSLATGFVVTTADVEGQKQGITFFGMSGPKAAPWGSGSSYQCVLGPVVRTPVQGSGGTSGSCDGNFSLDFNAWMAANPAKAPPGGSTVWLQTWFRDPPSPKSTSLSNALEVVVCP